VIGLFAIGAASVWLSSLASLRADEPPPPPAPLAAAIEPESVSTPVTAATPDPPAARPSEALQFRNPFDGGEVFEFPAGTNLADAHHAVAQYLLQRACERRNPLASTNAAESPCGHATTPADLLRAPTADAK
jgi:hypothetical protein